MRVVQNQQGAEAQGQLSRRGRKRVRHEAWRYKLKPKRHTRATRPGNFQSDLSVLLVLEFPLLYYAESNVQRLPQLHTHATRLHNPLRGNMYHLFKGLHEYMTRKDEYSVVIIGLDNVSIIA